MANVQKSTDSSSLAEVMTANMSAGSSKVRVNSGSKASPVSIFRAISRPRALYFSLVPVLTFTLRIVFLQHGCPFFFKAPFNFLEVRCVNRFCGSFEMPMVAMSIIISNDPAIIAIEYQVIDIR